VACLNDIKSERISLEIISSGVGLISKNDINNAHAAGAVIIGFSTKLEHGALAVAKHQSVQIIQHNIIYEIVNLVKEALADLLEPELKENKLGGAEVRQVFELSKDLIAGCMVTDGRVVRDGNVRLIRKKEVVAQGKITGLRRLKEDVTEVKAGYECGLQISGHPIYQIGDFVECFEIIKVRPPL
jgi:translation initiation factor IF-2